jgi:hypothetical protein
VATSDTSGDDKERAEMAAADERKRIRGRHLAAEVTTAIKSVIDKLEEMSCEVDIPATDILDLVNEDLVKDDPEGVVHHLGWYRLWAWMFPAAAYERDQDDPMKALIGRLLAAAPKLTDGRGHALPKDLPALPECMVQIKGIAVTPSGHPAFMGVLGVTRDGLLKIGAPGQKKDQSGAVKDCIFEQHFRYEDVAVFTVAKELPRVTRSRIVTPE